MKNRNKRTWGQTFRAPLCVLSAVALLSVPASAQDAEITEEIYPVEWTWGTQTGYDWSARPHATHVRMDATEPTTTIDVSNVGTAFLDVETTGLDAFGTYRLVHTVTGASVRDITGSSGETVFWNVPVVAGTWRIENVATGAIIADLILGDETPPPIDEIMWPMHSCTNRYGTCQPHNHGYQYQSRSGSSNYGSPYDRGSGGGGSSPPRPPTSQTGGVGVTTEQAALSYTSDAKVTTTTCWDHTLRVDSYVTGGFAGASGTAGGSKSYSRMECFQIHSQGTPMRLRFENSFQKDTYSDGSSKVYLTNKGEDMQYGAWSYNLPMSGRSITTTTTQPFAAEVTENNAGGVYFSGKMGSEAFGVGAGTTVSANGGQQSKVLIEIKAPDAATHRYVFGFVNGDDVNTGIIGAVWKEY